MPKSTMHLIRILAYSASIFSVLTFVGRCDSKTLAASDIQNSSVLEPNSLGSTIISDVEEYPEDWFAYVKKGKHLDEVWQKRNRPDNENTRLLRFFASVPPLPGRLTTAQTLMLNKLELSNQSSEWSQYEFRGSTRTLGTARDPEWSQKLHSMMFRCQISVQGRTILIQDWYRDDRQAAGDPSNAAVLWGMWQAAVERTTSQQAKQSQQCEVEIDMLKQIVYPRVTDPSTLALEKYALGKKKADVWLKPFPFEVHPDSQFWALSSTPAGINVQWLLIEHKVALRENDLIAITATCNPEDIDDPKKLTEPERDVCALVFHIKSPPY